MKEKAKNMYVSLGFIAVACSFLALIPYQVKGGGSQLQASKVLPTITLILIIVLNLVMLVQSIIEQKKAKQAGTMKTQAQTGIKLPANELEKKAIILVLICLGIFVAYVLVLKALGYLVATFVFLIIFNRLLGEKNWIYTIILALIGTIAFYWFTHKVNVFMPQGILKGFKLF